MEEAADSPYGEAVNAGEDSRETGLNKDIVSAEERYNQAKLRLLKLLRDTDYDTLTSPESTTNTLSNNVAEKSYAISGGLKFGDDRPASEDNKKSKLPPICRDQLNHRSHHTGSAPPIGVRSNEPSRRELTVTAFDGLSFGTSYNQEKKKQSSKGAVSQAKSKPSAIRKPDFDLRIGPAYEDEMQLMKKQAQLNQDRMRRSNYNKSRKTQAKPSKVVLHPLAGTVAPSLQGKKHANGALQSRKTAVGRKK